MGNQKALKFVIMSDSRSGTSLVSETLNTHPDVICHGEVFHPSPRTHIKGCMKGLSLDEVLALREASSADFLDWVFDQPEKRAVGFKMWRSQNPEICDLLLSDNAVLKIIYERENVLARFSSSLLVKATGIYNLRAGGRRPEKLKQRVAFDRRAFLAYLQRHQELFMGYRESARGPVVNVSYEEVKSRGFQKLLGFIGVKHVNLFPQKEKLHSSNIIARFNDHDHQMIRDTLSEIGHPEWENE